MQCFLCIPRCRRRAFWSSDTFPPLAFTVPEPHILQTLYPGDKAVYLHSGPDSLPLLFPPGNFPEDSAAAQIPQALPQKAWLQAAKKTLLQKKLPLSLRLEQITFNLHCRAR